MNDRLAFRALVSVSGFLLFCLACLLTLPLRLSWLLNLGWVVCCSVLMAQDTMPHSAPNWLGWMTIFLAGLLFSLMSGKSVLAAWQLWRATHRLTHAIQPAGLALSPVVARLARRLDLTGRLVIVPSRETFSFCYGLWCPRICLSLGLVELLTEVELEAVLRHEAYHLHRREPLRMAIAISLSHFFFFVPLLAELRDHYLAEKELSADAAAVAVTGRTSLARALHKIITIQPIPTIPPLAAVAGLSVTARRVDRLLNPAVEPSWSPSRRSTLIALAFFAAGCLLMFAGLV